MLKPWRMIIYTTLAAFLCTATVLVLVRGVAPAQAQEAEQELPPELRESADNNVSFPVDI